MLRKLIVLLILGALLAYAQSINLPNPSFETATLTLRDGNGPFCNLIPASTFASTGGSLANWTASSSAPAAAAGGFAPNPGGNNWTSKWWAGNNVGYLQISGAGTVSLSQTLSMALENNTTYTLSALVARRSFTPRFNYAIQLWAGSTMLASASNLTLAKNSSGTDTASYSSGHNNIQAGQPLVIVLSSAGAANVVTEAFFDSITLSASTAVTVSAVISASGFGGFTSVAPGSWVEIYGANLASDTRGWTGSDFNGVNAPTSLNGTFVTIGGQSAFVSYISPGQVNALIPSTVATGFQQVTVKTATGTSPPLTVTVNAQQPGLLGLPSFNLNGTPYTVAFFADGTFVLPTGAISGIASRPAKPGDIIVLYGIGFGPVTPNIPAGRLAEQSSALASSFQIFIGGLPAAVDYAGLAPNFTGLYQFNITVPNVPASNAVPLTFTLGGINGTQALNIAVQN